MRARQILPAGLALLTLLATGACGSSGLRVEGGGTPVSAPSPSPSPSPSPRDRPTKSATPMIAKEVTLEDVRQALLASKNLDADVHQVLENCTVVVRCLQRGANVDVMHSGLPQVVVIIKVLGDFSFGAFLLAPEPGGLRLVWSLKAEKLKIYPSPQSPQGDLVVESGIFRSDDYPCCPSGSRIEVYRWIDGRMRMISAKEQR